jgi:hypothetical protein
MLDLGLVNPGHSLATLYLIIAANFLAPLFGCRLQHFIESNFMVRHYIGFLTMLLFVRLTSATTSSFKNILGSSLIIYLWFIATTRVNFSTWLILITIISILFFIHYYESSHKDPDHKKTEFDTYLPEIKNGLVMALAAVTAIGMIIYAGEKKLEYGKKFNWLTFFIGVHQCKRKTPDYTLGEKLKALILKNNK